MVETPRKRKVTDLCIDGIVDKKRRNKQPRMAVSIVSTEDRLLPEEEDEDGLPPITFLPRVVRTEAHRTTSNTAGTHDREHDRVHDSVSTPDRSVVQLLSPFSEQRRPPIYVVEEEGNFIK